MPKPVPGHLLVGRRRSDGATVGVLDVPRGDRCDCDCAICGQPLRANQGRRRRYFSHVPEASPHCAEGALHRAICEAMAAMQSIHLVPLREVPRLEGQQRVVRAIANSWMLEQQFRPDVLLETAAGIRLAVEVVHTNPLSGYKLQALQQENLLVLLVDAKELGAALLREGPSRQALEGLVRRAGPWQSWPVIENMHQPDLIDSIRPWWDVLGEQPIRELRELAAMRRWN